MHAAPLVALVVEASPWTAQLDVLDRLIPLGFVAILAWLAFGVFDTGAGVGWRPRRWADVGLLAALAFVVQEASMVWAFAHESASTIERFAADWTSYYTGPEGELLVGWVLVSGLAVATAEELVYRALLLRGLEGYLGRWPALLVHALVFEAVHVFVYGYGFHGGNWFVAALIYGYAFQRTRALAVPVLMHASAWLLFYVTIWALAR